MAVIPIFSSRKSQVRADPNSFGLPEGRQDISTGGHLSSLGIQIQKKEKNKAIARASSLLAQDQLFFSQRLQKLREETPLEVGLFDAFRQEYADRSAETLGMARNSFEKEIISLEQESRLYAHAQRIIPEDAERAVAERLIRQEQDINTESNMLLLTPELYAETLTARLAVIENSGVNQIAQEKLKQQAQNNYASSAFGGAIQQSVSEEEVSVVISSVKRKEIRDNISTSVFKSLLAMGASKAKDIERQNKAAGNLARKQAVSSMSMDYTLLRVKITDGTATDSEISGFFAKWNDMSQALPKYVTLYEKQYEKTKSLSNEADDVQYIAAKLQNRQAAHPSDQSKVDTYYQAILPRLQEIEEKFGVNVRAESENTLINTLKIIPSKLVKDLELSLEGSDDAAMVSSSQRIAKLSALSESIEEKFGHLSKRAIRISSLVDLGYTDPKSIVETVKSWEATPQEDRLARKKFLASRESGIDWLSLSKDLVGTNTALAVDDVRKLVTSRYQAHGILNIAKQEAKASLARIWGDSIFDGSNRRWRELPENSSVVRNSLESEYSVPGLSRGQNSSWIRDDIIVFLKKIRENKEIQSGALKGTLISQGLDVDFESLGILANKHPYKTFNGKPLYIISIMKEGSNGGQVMDVVSDQYYPDWEQSSMYRTLLGRSVIKGLEIDAMERELSKERDENAEKVRQQVIQLGGGNA